MTKTQIVRRQFKSALPRRIKNQQLSPMEALSRTVELFDRLRGMMEAAGLDKRNASAGLVDRQPETKGEEAVLARTVALPREPQPKEIGKFAETVLSLDKPLFLGILFGQHDPHTDNPKYRDTIFVWPFMLGSEAEGRLIAARGQMAQGGFKKKAN